MTLTNAQIKVMQEDMYASIVQLLMEHWGYTMEEAIGVLYNSDTFLRLQDKNTGFYYQSPGYVYSFLEHEMTNGTFGE